MLLEHRGKAPTVHPSAYVAPTAVLCGDVHVGEDSRVLFGAILTAEGGQVTVGDRCVVMENAVMRGTPGFGLRVGNNVLIGPRASLSGCVVDDDVFVATGATVFNGATIGRGAEVRVNGVVHIRTALPAGATVPIGWVAVGTPARILPPSAHEDIWAVQEPLDFAGTVFGLERKPVEELMPELAGRYTRALGRHRDDRRLG
jgi:carbonic anhydrase/acetyltransferase-like protein (isoleucine patch superfamily)